VRYSLAESVARGERTSERGTVIRRAAACVAVAVALSSCGADEPVSTSATTTGDDRAEEIQDLQEKVRELKREREPEASEESTQLDLRPVVSGLDGEAAVAVITDERSVAEAGDLSETTAWSTIKVPIAIRVIEDAGGPDGLSSAQASLIERAITASDNEAAAELFASIAAEHGGEVAAAQAVTDILRKAGKDQPDVSTEGRATFSSYGQTQWPVGRQAEFMAALADGRVASPETQRYVLDLMGRITSDAWGLGGVGVQARWKSGWGPAPDGGYLLRQMGIAELGDGPVVVALAAAPADGTYESGQVLMTEIASRLIALAEGQAP